MIRFKICQDSLCSRCNKDVKTNNKHDSVDPILSSIMLVYEKYIYLTFTEN